MAANLTQTRVVDPVLTTVARGYRHAMYASMMLFPVAPVDQRGGKIITFGAEDFAKLDLVRSPGSNRQRLNVGYEGENYTCVQRALDGSLPIERLQEAQSVPGIDLGRRTTSTAMNSVWLQIEAAAASAATTTSNYSATHRAALAGNARWDNDASKPAKAVEEIKETIATSIGLEPNIMVVGPAVGRALVNHPDVVDRVKHTHGPGEGGNAPVVNAATMASYFGVERFLVARARSGTPGNFSPLWGKHAILAYSAISTMAAAEADMGEPSFGYTYRVRGYPIVESAWYDRGCDSWIYPVTTEDTPVIAGKDAGYLFSTVVD